MAMPLFGLRGAVSSLGVVVGMVVFASPGTGLRAQSATALADRPAYVSAVSALREGRSALAAEKLDQLIEAADNLAPADAEAVRLLRLEALVRSRATSAALNAISDDVFPRSPKRDFWHGLALIQARRYQDAVERLSPLVESLPPGFPDADELRLNLAIARHRTGDSEGAVALLTALSEDAEAALDTRQRAVILAARIEMERERYGQARTRLEEMPDPTGSSPPPDPVAPAGANSFPAAFESRLLAGRIALKQGKFDEAGSLFSEVAGEAEGTPAGDRASLGRADVALAESRFRQAALLLQSLIADRPDSPFTGAAFQRLNQLGEKRVPGLLRRLEAWSGDESAPSRRAFALFFFAVVSRAEGQPDVAVAALGDFLAGYPRHPLREAAELQLADALIDTGLLDEADRRLRQLKSRAALPSTQVRLGLLDARLRFARDQRPGSLDDYRKTLEQPGATSASRIAAAFNGALAAAATGEMENYDTFAAALARLTSEDSEVSGDLLLERGLFEARESEPGAFETLEEFVRRFPDHPRLADAQIALAEMYLNQVPAQSVSAREHLEMAQSHPLSLEQHEWLDYVSIWVEVSANQNLDAITRADRFLNDWPRSERRPSVFMLLGESYYRAGDFPNAIRSFQSLAEEAPDSSLAEPALFFAARSAAQSLDPSYRSDAITLWTRVAESGHELANAARHELGLLHLSLEQFAEAVADFDAVIAAEDVDPVLQIAALADKGEALFAGASLMESDNTAMLESAAEAFAEAGRHEAATKSWRLQTAVRRGKCLEALGRVDEALALYRDVVSNGSPAGPVAAAPVAEYDWYYRAGLAAIRLLQEEEGDQRSAVAVADQIAQAGGPRAAEAARIADQLRLRHFLWQDPEG